MEKQDQCRLIVECCIPLNLHYWQNIRTFLPDITDHDIENTGLNIKMMQPAFRGKNPNGFTLRRDVADKINEQKNKGIRLRCPEAGVPSDVIPCVVSRAGTAGYTPVISGDYQGAFVFNNHHYIPLKSGVMSRMIWDSVYRGFRTLTLAEEQAGLEPEEAPLYRYDKGEYTEMELQLCHSKRVARSPVNILTGCFAPKQTQNHRPPPDDWTGKPEKKYVLHIGVTGSESPETFEAYACSVKNKLNIPDVNLFSEKEIDVNYVETQRRNKMKWEEKHPGKTWSPPPRPASFYQAPEATSLSHLDKTSRLYVVAHGASTGTGPQEWDSSTGTFDMYTPERLATRLYSYGLREVGVLRIDACYTGQGNYLARLKTALDNKGIKVGYLSAPTGAVTTTNFLKTRFVFSFNDDAWRIIRGNENVSFDGTKYTPGAVSGTV